MNLYIDVGNTLTKFAKMENSYLKEFYAYPTNQLKTLDCSLFSLYEKVFISSVVPNATKELTVLFKEHEIKVIDNKENTDIEIILDNPDELGVDLLCDLVGVKTLEKEPSFIIDLGTATKILVLEKGYVFKTAVIFPGIELSYKSLNDNTALLKNYDVSQIKEYKDCHNTKDVLASSIIYSHADAINGAVHRLEKIYDYPFKKYLTGGNANIIKDLLDFEFVEVDNLALIGLKEISKKYE